MAMLQGLTKPIQKNLPKANNLVSAGVTGIGGYSIARFIDNLIGGRLQAIGIGLPIIGSLSALDLVMILSFKATMRKNSMVAAAFAGDRIFNLRQGIPGITPGLNLSTAGLSSAAGPQGGGLF